MLKVQRSKGQRASGVQTAGGSQRQVDRAQGGAERRAKGTAKSGEGFNDPAHPMFAVMLKLGDALADKGSRHMDLRKNKWSETKAKEMKPEELYRAKSDWLADQIASSVFKGSSEIEKATRFCSLLDGNDRLRMTNNLREQQEHGGYTWESFVETWMFPEGKAAATEVVRAEVQRKCGEGETMTHYFENKVDKMRRLGELCPLEAQKCALLREMELVNSFKEGLYMSTGECAATQVFRALVKRSHGTGKVAFTVAELRALVMRIEHVESQLLVKRPTSLQSRFRAATSDEQADDYQSTDEHQTGFSRVEKGDNQLGVKRPATTNAKRRRPQTTMAADVDFFFFFKECKI
jgi:hypothetical protein